MKVSVGLALASILLASTSACGGPTSNASPSPPDSATRTATATPTRTPSPTPTPVPTRTLSERLGVPVTELRLLPPAPLPVGWELLARQGPCYGCGFGLGDPRLWKRAPELEYTRLLANLSPGPGYPYGFVHDRGLAKIVVAWCRTGYCGGESDPSEDATAELYVSEDAGASWSQLGDLDAPDSPRGFFEGRLLMSDYEINGRWKVTFRFWQGEPLPPPDGMTPNWVFLPPEGRRAVWLQYGAVRQSPGEYRDNEGPILPPLKGEFDLIAFFGEDAFLWGVLKPPVADDERQPESLLVVADRNGTARRAWIWYGGWWLLRGLTADRYLVGHMEDPDALPGGPVSVVVDLEEGTVVPIAGLPRSYEDSYTYPTELFIGSP